MMPGKFDLKLYRGDSYSWQFKLWKDPAKTQATDLTGCTVACEVRDKPAGSKIVDLPCQVTLPNIISVTMSPGQCASCPAKGVWDLQITFPDGQVQSPVAGSVFVTADVTAST